MFFDLVPLQFLRSKIKLHNKNDNILVYMMSYGVVKILTIMENSSGQDNIW
jgi:hypothetical protein